MHQRFARICLATLVLAGVATASFTADEDPKKPALNEKSAGPDFAVQGEYTGTIQEEDEKAKLGVQVIALGDGKFQAVGFIGGLPGDGWNGEERIRVEGKSRDGSLLFDHPDEGEGSGELKDGKLIIRDSDGNKLGELKKVVRKSPTLGRKPPEGAVVLFDGSTADKFAGGKLSDDGYLMQGCTSKDKFGSFTLHIEFMLSFMPYARGQGRSNSGIYMQGRYEVQMLDSFGLEGKHNECGGVYSIHDPDVNMCFPPLSWQTYDVDYTAAKFDKDGKKTANARMTVRHNGVVVHKDLELPHSTTASPLKEGPEPGPIYLQNHGNPLRYRNIWVVPAKN